MQKAHHTKINFLSFIFNGMQEVIIAVLKMLLKQGRKKKEKIPDLIFLQPTIIWSKEGGVHWQVCEVLQELPPFLRGVGVSHDVLGRNKIQLY